MKPISEFSPQEAKDYCKDFKAFVQDGGSYSRTDWDIYFELYKVSQGIKPEKAIPPVKPS